MPITTWPQVQTILSLPATSQGLVEALIPLVEADYLRIRNRPFEIGIILTVTDPATVAGTMEVELDGVTYEVALLATDTELRIARKIWLALSTSRVLSSYLLDYEGAVVRLVLYDSTDSPVLTVDPGPTGMTATVSDPATVYPVGAELTAIRMILHHTAGGVGGVQSETLSDHSITYETASSSGMSYPDAITGGIKRFMSWER